MPRCRNLLAAIVAGAAMLTAAAPLAHADPGGFTISPGGPNEFTGPSATPLVAPPVGPVIPFKVNTPKAAGQAQFVTLGTFRFISACDLVKDGAGVRAYTSFDKKTINGFARDIDKANGKCQVQPFLLGTPLKKLYLKACLRDHDGKNPDSRGKDVDYDCSEWKEIKI